MSTEKSELHITDIAREDKGRWVYASRAQKMKLTDWAIKILNEAAREEMENFVHPTWTKGLSKRSARALVNFGYAGKREVRADFENTQFDALQIPNLVKKGAEEIRDWLNK